MRHDSLITQMQETGRVFVGGMTLAEAMRVVDALGIDPAKVEIRMGGIVFRERTLKQEQRSALCDQRLEMRDPVEIFVCDSCDFWCSLVENARWHTHRTDHSWHTVNDEAEI